MEECYRDKVYVITGAANGIGRRAAMSLARRGAKLALADIEEDALAAVAAELDSGGCLYRRTDVARAEDNQALVRAALDSFGRIDGAVLNVGVPGAIATIPDTDAELFDRVMAVNVRGTWLGLKYLIPEIARGGGGAIVLTGSTAGFRAGAPGRAPYVASKHAVIGLMRAAAAECAPLGIRVNSVSPGGVNTRMSDTVKDVVGETRARELLAAFEQSIPLKRLAEPDEIADVMLFLLSDASRYCTGTNIMVDGGLMG